VLLVANYLPKTHPEVKMDKPKQLSKDNNESISETKSKFGRMIGIASNP